MKERSSLMARGLRILRSYVATHPVPFTVAVSGAAVYAAATIGTTVVLGRITDRVLRPAFEHGVSWGTIAWAAGAIAAVGFIRAGGIVVRRYFAGMTGFRMQRTLRTRIVDRYRELPLAFHRAHPTGDLIAHAESDVDAATEVLNPLPWSTAVVLLMVFAAIELILTDPFLAVIGISILPGLAVMNRFYTRRVEGPAARIQERIGEVSSVAHESIDGALVVKTLGREEHEVQRLADKAEQLRQERVALGRNRATFEPFLDMLPNIGIILVLLVGSWRVSRGAITIGDLVQIVALFQLVAFPLRLIGYVLSDLPRSVVSRERLEEVFQERTTLPTATQTFPLTTGPLGVFVRDVSYSYQGNPVLERLSFEVRPNEAVALVGPTGVGKSTLVQLLVRLDDPDEGSIHIGGVDLRHLAALDLRRSVAIVLQESFLFATSVRENLVLDRDVTEDEMRQAARLAQADEFILALQSGYDTVLGERGVTLSGGQRQRVALARALLGRPRLLILDDATSSVDPTVEAAILEGLRRELRATLVVVAYRVSTIGLTDRVLFLDGGRIVAEGTHESLLSHPAYEAMVRAYEVGAA
jgi:ABC-type multidrug transport system fused ATPase/permease subunit